MVDPSSMIQPIDYCKKRYFFIIINSYNFDLQCGKFYKIFLLKTKADFSKKKVLRIYLASDQLKLINLNLCFQIVNYKRKTTGGQ